MAGAEAASGIAIKIFVKKQIIAPMFVRLQFFRIAEYRPLSTSIAKKDAA